MKPLFRNLLAHAALVVCGASASVSCLQRPLGTDQPKTTNVIVDSLKQSSVDKIDLLFMIDNSLSMGDKQVLLAEALPDLVNRLVDPVCISAENPDDSIAPENGACRAGYSREFQPINNIHIGVITSSLGGFGSELDCTIAEEGETDNSHLLGSLARVRTELPNTPNFLTWCLPGSDSQVNGDCVATAETSDGNAAAFSAVFAEQVQAAKEFGCGWEASLEAWYRFLVEPQPWTEVVRQNCPFGGDMQSLCIGPKLDANGIPEPDQTILQQRAEFLRADSLLAVVMLTDENDCSFKASGQSWRLSQTFRYDDEGRPQPSRAYRAASVCATNPNDRCCVSCGAGVPADCATGLNADGETVSAGCENPIYESADDLAAANSDEPTDDAVNLRCFDQKRRFGVDYLYPVARYSNALKNTNICPFADDLDPNAVNSSNQPVCGAEQEFVVPNPLYLDLGYEARLAANPNAAQVIARDQSLVFLAGIVGVPWQDLAVDRNAATLEYKTNNPVNAPNVIDWQQLLGSATVGAPYDLLGSPPTDPLMHEQIEPRTGTDTSVNGGEWNSLDKDDLQYVCTFPLDTPRECMPVDELDPGVTVACDCTYYGDEAYDNPLCDGLTQTRGKAYPGIRPLQVLRDYGANSIVASICPKNTTDREAADYGYRPAVAAIVDRLKEQLKDKCLPRRLEVEEDENGGLQANCIIVEANPAASATCDGAAGRTEVEAGIAEKVYERLERTNTCEGAECQRFHLCTIEPLQPGTADYESCLESDNPPGAGWCYIDPEQGLGDASQVEKCAETERRKIRFSQLAAPKKGTITFFACAGAPQGGSTAEEVPEGDMPAVEGM
jgi:hypothetical protein